MELPKAVNGNFGERNLETESDRVSVPPRTSSENGNNIYTPPKGQKIEDLVKDGYSVDGKGNAQCVQLVKTLVGAPATPEWREGRKIQKGDDIPPGTAIATFVDGKYPQSGGAGNRHAAIYIGQDDQGIWVLDQAVDREKGNLIQTRRIPWDRTKYGVSNNGSAFSVIEWGPRQGKAGSGR